MVYKSGEMQIRDWFDAMINIEFNQNINTIEIECFPMYVWRDEMNLMYFLAYGFI